MLKQLLLIFAGALYLISAVQPTTYTYKTVQNLDIEANVYVPTTNCSPTFPVILALHGGGYVVGTKLDAFTDQELNEMLSRCWVVVSIDYRLSPGALIQDIVQDVQDAYQWIRTDFANIIPININAIGIWGGSAGGGLSVLAGYKLTPRPKVVVSFYPYCTNFTDAYAYNPDTPLNVSFIEAANTLRSPIAAYNATDVSDARMMLFFTGLAEQKNGWVLTTEDPNEPSDKILDMLKEYSVVDNIDFSYPPTYLAHGLGDTLVPYQQSAEMAAVLNKTNIPYKLDLVPEVNHAFDFMNITDEFWQEHVLPAFDFMEKYIMGEPEPITRDSIISI